MMFQDPYASLDPRMRVQAILREPLDDPGDRLRTRAGRADHGDCSTRSACRMNALERYPHEFSGGQRQRIALARALMLEPKVIVADEPVSALDVSIRSQVLNLMKRLQAEHDMASIVISHDLAVVKYLSDRIGVMYLGKLVELGTGDDIYHARRPPLHRRADQDDPAARPARPSAPSRRSRSAASCRARSTRRRAAASAPAARARRRALRRGGAAAARASARAIRPPATSRCASRRTRGCRPRRRCSAGLRRDGSGWWGCSSSPAGFAG